MRVHDTHEGVHCLLLGGHALLERMSMGAGAVALLERMGESFAWRARRQVCMSFGCMYEEQRATEESEARAFRSHFWAASSRASARVLRHASVAAAVEEAPRLLCTHCGRVCELLTMSCASQLGLQFS